MSESTAETQPTAPEGGEQQEQVFKQADVDRIVRERVQRERAKFADYDELKSRAGEKQSADERIAALENDLQSTRHEAMKRRIQAAHGISDEDANLFLTGADEESLSAQAARLAARTAEQHQNGNHVPTEGKNPTSTDGEEKQFLNKLFGG